MSEQSRNHFLHFPGLPRLAFRGRGPLLYLPVVQIHDILRHEGPGNQGVFRKVEGQAEPGEALQYALELFHPPVPLVLMALDAHRPDRDACIQELRKQLFIGRGGIKVVDQKHRVRIALPGRLKDVPDQGQPAPVPADPGHRIVVLVKYGHDHHFVDDIPHVHNPAVSGHLPADPGKLPAQDLRIVKFEQPRRTHRVPAQRMALDPDPARLQKAGRRHGFPVGGLPFLGLVAAPVKRQRAVIEKLQPFVQDAFDPFPLFCGLFSRLLFQLRKGYGIEGAAAKEKGMADLIHLSRAAGKGRSVPL